MSDLRRTFMGLGGDEWAAVIVMVAVVAAIVGVAVGALRFAVAALIVAVVETMRIVAGIKRDQLRSKR